LRLLFFSFCSKKLIKSWERKEEKELHRWDTKNKGTEKKMEFERKDYTKA
jgi:hypothetical protein